VSAVCVIGLISNSDRELSIKAGKFRNNHIRAINDE
jgi:hypothetical protein